MNEDYLDLQNCGISSLSNVDIKFEFGIWKNVDVCPAPIIWFEEEVDFISSSRTGDIEVSREEIDNGGNYKVTESGKITMSREMVIKPTQSSKLVQKYAQILIENEGTNGEVLKKYSDGGFHFRLTVTNRLTGAVWTQLALNAKSGNFLDVFFNDSNDTELEKTLSFTCERDYIHLIRGVMSDNFGLPTAMAKIDVTYGAITNDLTSITIPSLTLVDADLAAVDESVTVFIYNEDGDSLGSKTLAASGDLVIEDLVIAPGAVLDLEFAYKSSDVKFWVCKTDKYTII